MSQATLHDRAYHNSGLFSGHYLDDRVQERDEWDCDEAAREAMESLQALFDLEGELVEGYGEDALIDNWIDEVLDVLGFGTQVEVTLPDGSGFVDELLFASPTDRREAAKVYLDTEETADLFERGVGIVEAKQWDAAFDVQFSEQRPYRNASHQTKHYLENTPANIQWGVLTNGRKWRLYGTHNYETQTYYEVDLPELLAGGDLAAFKYFYVFFRADAFRESAGTTFHDEVWSESETASQELGEDLQDNVFTALRVLGRGFVETNDDLDIDPDDEAALDELKEQSLVFLYRLMFVLYAEARGLIHPEDQAAQEEYDQNFSLDELRLEIHDAVGEVDEGFAEEFSAYSTTMWSRLEDLFGLIDEGKEELGIPPYNGGLFDHEAHEFLTENEVSNQYLAEVIYRLSTTRNDEGRYVLADYADLDTRHLGSVYEGLLEHQFRIAPEQYAAVAEDGGQLWKPATEVSVADAVETVPEGGLYVVNDEGERKATGAYYTPDYVVTYIVEETVGPLVTEIREDLRAQGLEPGTREFLAPFVREITDLTILDPAMGSGHFLTKATSYLASEAMKEYRAVEAEMDQPFDEEIIRRDIAKECIYGVDLNGMAVELAKLSMWLETLAADRPLAFLDHHFKQGNSLVGSDIEDIEELESDASDEDDQYSLAEFGATREGTIERLMDIYSEFLTIENEGVEDVRAMKRKYAEIEQDDLRQRLVAMANVHTAERFGIEIPSEAYEQMAKALQDDSSWANLEGEDWFKKAQTMADDRNFFHWKLSFPEVFYQSNGSLKEEAGFDAVIGNPPYFSIDITWGKNSEDAKYIKRKYPEIWAGKSDIYYYFVSQGIQIAKVSGEVSFITSRYFLEAHYSEKLREYIKNNSKIKKIVDFGNNTIFKGVGIKASIFVIEKSHNEVNNENIRFYRFNESINSIDEGKALKKLKLDNDYHTISSDNVSSDSWNLSGWENYAISNSIDKECARLGEICEIGKGMETGANRVFEVSQETIDEYGINKDFVEKLIKNQDINRYHIDFRGKYIIYPENIDDISEHDGLHEYFKDHQGDLKSRAAYERGDCEWFKYTFPLHQELYDSPKIVVPFVSPENRFALDADGQYIGLTDTCAIFPGTKIEDNYLLGLLNSKLLEFRYQLDAKPKDYRYEYFENRLKDIPIKSVGQLSNETESGQESCTIVEKLSEYEGTTAQFYEEIGVNTGTNGEKKNIVSQLTSEIEDMKIETSNLNLNLLDYIQFQKMDSPITGFGSYHPPKGVGDTKLAATKEDYDNLRVGTVTCEREGENTVVVHATARYKPDDQDGHETDQWGYTETESMPAMRLSDLSRTEADLVEAFVPVAVEEAGGFAGFRETATKTNSLVDRLEAITLPDPDDVADDLERYREAVERAEQLDEKIRRTDDLIDEIVYDLYGLTDEEIEIVEASVNDD